MNRTAITQASFTILVLLCALSMAGLVQAIDIAVVTHDTDVQSTYTNLKVCSCGSQVDAVRIKNLGDLAAHYRIELSGDHSWFTLDRNAVTLSAGESTEVYVFTQAPCDAVAEAHYTVYVSSEYGRYRAIEKTITTGVCENIKTSITPTTATIQPCGSQEFALTITNTATFPELYKVDGPAFGSIALGAGESGTLRSNYTAACDEWGSKDIPVTVRSDRNGLVRTENIHITVPRAYDYELSIDDFPQPICANVATTAQVHVRNVEDRANTITLTTNTGNTTTVFVPAKRTVTTSIPVTWSGSGEYTFRVNAVGANGSIEKETSLTTNVEACYGLSVEGHHGLDACTGSVYLPFTITSAGNRVQDITYDVRSNTTTTINGRTDVLHPGETITKNVEAIIPNIDRQWYITLLATTPYVNGEKTVLVNGYSTESCYKVQPTTHAFRVWSDQTLVPIVIEHSGIQPATYTIHYNGSTLIPLEQTLTIGPGNTAVVHFAVNANHTGTSIERFQLSTHGVDYTTDFAVTVANKGLWEQFLDRCNADNNFAVCSATSVVSGLLLLVAILIAAAVTVGFIAFFPSDAGTRKVWSIVGSLLLIILLIVMLVSAPVIPRSYVRPVGPSNATDLSFEIGQGQSIPIKIGAYFLDPDADRMTYSVSPTRGLSVHMNGSSAIVTANTEFSGTEHLVFTASDGRGGYTDSDVFSISVVPFRPITFLELWHRACWFITALLLFLAVAILTLTVIYAKPKRENRDGASTSTHRAGTHTTRSHKRESDASASENGANDDVIVEIEGEHALTDREREIVEQAKSLVRAEQVVINQGAVVENVFVASSSGEKFHRINCPLVRNIPKEKRVTFTTQEDAVKGGYTPCKNCGSHS